MRLSIIAVVFTALIKHVNGDFGVDHPLFLVSRITEDQKWCLTANEEATEVSLELCDFGGAPNSQVWYRTDDEQILTSLVPLDTDSLGNNRCLAYEDDKVFINACDSDRIRFDSWPGWPWEAGEYAPSESKLKAKSDPGGCVAPKDETPSAGGEITLLSCDEADSGRRVVWRFYFVSCDGRGGGSTRLCNDDGCIQADNSNRVKVVEALYSDQWGKDGGPVEATCLGVGIIHLDRDPSLCLQKVTQDGDQVQVHPCECNNELQQFGCEYWSDLSLPCMYTTEGSDSVISSENCDAVPESKLIGVPDYYPADEYPVTLLTAGQYTWQRTVEAGEREVRARAPTCFKDGVNLGCFICVIQQGDGNFRVLRSQNPGDCENKVGNSIFKSGFSLKQPNGETYYTRLQRDGNLLTQTSDRKKTVWKTCSNQPNTNDEYALVLNADDSLSILTSDGNEIWNSETDEPCNVDRPLVLMSSASGGRNIVEHRSEFKVYDPLTDTDICVRLQGDGNFRVLRGGCTNGSGTVIFRSGFVGQDTYYTKLQRDGNLITFTESGDWVWKTCSSQGSVSQDFFLVLGKDDKLSIINDAGEPIWHSSFDRTCFA